jgi:hypothetical protein
MLVSRPLARHLLYSSSPEDAGAPSIPARISVPPRIARITAGADAATSAPMDFLPFVNPHGSVFYPICTGVSHLLHMTFLPGLCGSRCDLGFVNPAM